MEIRLKYCQFAASQDVVSSAKRAIIYNKGKCPLYSWGLFFGKGNI